MPVLDVQHPDVQDEVARAAARTSGRQFRLVSAPIHLIGQQPVGREEQHALLVHPERAGLAVKALQALALLQVDLPAR